MDKNSKRKGGWLQTHLNGQFWPLDPRPEEVFIEDIAHALACVNRYNGMAPKPYSVAQHSVIVSLHCNPEDALWGLLHDASESYVADLISPVKKYMPEYRKVEDKLMRVICDQFGLQYAMPESVKRADLMVLAAESRDFYPKKPASWKLPLRPVKMKIVPVGWEEAERMFLERFAVLYVEYITQELLREGWVRSTP